MSGPADLRAAMTDYHRLIFLLPPELEDELAAALWSRGTLGMEIIPVEGGKLQAVAYFPDPLPLGGAELAAGEPLPGVELVALARMGEEDWLAQFRSRSLPFAVGRTLWVDPGEPDPEASAPAGRRLLRLPARRAFGTGSHESTRLAVELLEETPVTGLDILDVGTGTGILSFAALLGGARRAVGCDVDPAAALLAGDNRRRNDLGPAFFAGTLAALAPGVRFDLALVNITPSVFLPALPDLRPLLRPGGGQAIFSGILAAQEPEVVAALEEGGFPLRRSRQAGEWVALQSGVESG